MLDKQFTMYYIKGVMSTMEIVMDIELLEDWDNPQGWLEAQQQFEFYVKIADSEIFNSFYNIVRNDLKEREQIYKKHHVHHDKEQQKTLYVKQFAKVMMALFGSKETH